jgi:hypothetical protein
MNPLAGTDGDLPCSTMSGYCCSGLVAAGLAVLARRIRFELTYRRQVAELRRLLEGAGPTRPALIWRFLDDDPAYGGGWE